MHPDAHIDLGVPPAPPLAPATPLAQATGLVAYLRARRPILSTLVVVLALNLAGLVLIRPFVAAALRGDAGIPFASTALVVAALISPAVAFGRAALFTVLAWSLATLAGRSLASRAVLTVFTAGECIRALAGLFAGSVYHLRGLSSFTTPADLAIPQGIDIFVDLASPRLLALAQGATLFHLGWFVFTLVMLPRVAGTSRRFAVAVAVVAWCTILLFGVARAGLTV